MAGWIAARNTGRPAGRPGPLGGLGAEFRQRPVRSHRDVEFRCEAELEASDRRRTDSSQASVHGFTEPDIRAVSLSALVWTFFSKGGLGLHISVVDADVLRSALKEPDKYLDLMVRVGGFSAPFVLLSPEIQKSILERTEQYLGL